MIIAIMPFGARCYVATGFNEVAGLNYNSVEIAYCSYKNVIGYKKGEPGGRQPGSLAEGYQLIADRAVLLPCLTAGYPIATEPVSPVRMR
jgi:hypothetical protein